jgi:hypothetical protein
MHWDTNFTQQFWVNEEKVERKKERLELVQPWRVNYRESWSILECNWSWKPKNQVFMLEE